MTDRERANKLLLEHTALEHLKEDMSNNWECIIDAMIKFRNEGLREELIKYDKWNLAGSHGAIPTESILKNIDNYFEYLKTKK